MKHLLELVPKYVRKGELGNKRESGSRSPTIAFVLRPTIGFHVVAILHF